MRQDKAPFGRTTLALEDDPENPAVAAAAQDIACELLARNGGSVRPFVLTAMRECVRLAEAESGHTAGEGPDVSGRRAGRGGWRRWWPVGRRSAMVAIRGSVLSPRSQRLCSCWITTPVFHWANASYQPADDTSRPVRAVVLRDLRRVGRPMASSPAWLTRPASGGSAGRASS